MGSINRALEELLLITRHTSHEIAIIKAKVAALEEQNQENELTAEEKVNIYYIYIQTTTRYNIHIRATNNTTILTTSMCIFRKRLKNNVANYTKH